MLAFTLPSAGTGWLQIPSLSRFKYQHRSSSCFRKPSILNVTAKEKGSKKGFSKNPSNSEEKILQEIVRGPRRPSEEFLSRTSGGLTVSNSPQSQPPKISNQQSGVLPEVVAERMGKRMFVLCGVPLFVGISGFLVYFFLSYKFDITFYPAVVAYSTLATFGTALFGLTYGIMSASWDPEKEGSLLGIQEFKANFISAVDGVNRARKREIIAVREEKVDRKIKKNLENNEKK